MPFCPKCKFEYEVGIIKCADCDIPLMAQLSEEKVVPEPETELVSVIQVATEPEAIFYCDMLSRVGINATYRSFSVPGYGDAIREAEPCWGEMLVLDEDEEKAAEVIVDYLKTLDTQEIEETPEEEP